MAQSDYLNGETQFPDWSDPTFTTFKMVQLQAKSPGAA
jgi:hypothetical protein